MDFANEYYVRLYTRDTTTWKRLKWDGQCVLMQMLRKMDMGGVLDIEDMEPWEAVILHCPGAREDQVKAGMASCLELGVLEHNGHYLVAPKYREANEANKSNKQRQLESRARRRDSALKSRGPVTECDKESRAVTPKQSQNVAPRDTPSVTTCDIQSQNVTPESRDVTPESRAVTSGHTLSHAVTLTNSGSDTNPNPNTNSNARELSRDRVNPSPNGHRRSLAEESSPEGEGWAKLYAAWESILGVSSTNGSAYRVPLSLVWRACVELDASDPEQIFRRAAQAFVDEKRVKDQTCELSFLCSGFAGWAERAARDASREPRGRAYEPFKFE